MNLDKVAFHNVGGMEPVPGHSDNGFMRIPASVRNQLNNRARFVGMDSIGCEMRFVTDDPNSDIYISCTTPEFVDEGKIRIFRGNFQCAIHSIAPGKTHNIRLIEPDSFKGVARDKITLGGFSSNVWRVCCDRGATFTIHGVDCHGYDLRKPNADEVPKLKWLAYGSSITNSSLSGYPHIASRILKVDVENKGLSGACHVEREISDWLADECEWDFITCELGVNMRGCFTPEQFRERITYLLRKLTSTHPEKKVIAINVFPNSCSADWVSEDKDDYTGTERETAFNTIVSEVVKEINSENLHFIEGYEILSDFAGLSGDLLHPCEFGQSLMGVNLAGKLKEILSL